MKKLSKKPQVLESETAYKGKVFSVLKTKIREGDKEYERETITHNGSAVIVPVTRDNEVILVKQYRHATEKYLLELPAGSVEIDETPEQCAFREVEEEIGMKAEQLEKLTEFYVSPGFLNEKMHVFLATELTKSEQNLDEDEIISIEKIPLEKAFQKIAANEIEDAKTMIGLIFAGKRLDIDF